MNIPFRRIGETPQAVNLTCDDAGLEGTLESKGRSLVLFKGRITGQMGVDCDICAEPFALTLDEPVEFLLCDGIYEGENETYDVIEIEGGVIDMDEIFQSELELIRSDYHRCSQC